MRTGAHVSSFPTPLSSQTRARSSLSEGSSLADVVRTAPSSTTTAIELHVGAAEPGDMREAEVLHAAVLARGRAGVSMSTHVHANRDHNLVVHLRDSGELHEMLRTHIVASRQPQDRSAPHPFVASTAFVLTPLAAPPSPSASLPLPPAAAEGGHAGSEPAAAAAPAPAAAASGAPAAALEEAARALAADQPVEALATLDMALQSCRGSLVSALVSAEHLGPLWVRRAGALAQLRRFVDGFVSLRAAAVAFACATASAATTHSNNASGSTASSSAMMASAEVKRDRGTPP